MLDTSHFDASSLFSPFLNRFGSMEYMSAFASSGVLANTGLDTVPFICRLAALLLLLPFVLCIGLDIIAYAIARTLRLSMLQARVPGSPGGSSASAIHEDENKTVGYSSSFAFAKKPPSSDKVDKDSLGLSMNTVGTPQSHDNRPGIEGIDGSDFGSLDKDGKAALTTNHE